MTAFLDFTQPFKLYTNASRRGLETMYQEQNEKLRILGFGSKIWWRVEKKYYSSKLEFSGLKWSIRDYLYYAKHFDVYADFNPLTYIRTSFKLKGTS